jgi:predicted amidohydrolase YtcJ
VGFNTPGELRPSAQADFTVLSSDPFTTPLSEIAKISTVSTFLEGSKIFGEM